MPANVDPRLAAFSLEYALYQDERFEEVGPAGEMAWFLKRLEPPEVTFPPRRLTCDTECVRRRPRFPNRSRPCCGDLNDEWGPGETPPADESGEVSLILSFPHWRVGTLPLNPRLAAIFPQAHRGDPHPF